MTEDQKPTQGKPKTTQGENSHSKRPLKMKKKMEFRLNFSMKNIFIFLFVLFIATSFLASIRQNLNPTEDKPLSQVLSDIKDGEVARIEVEETRLDVTYNDGTEFVVQKEPQDSIYQIFDAAGIDPEDVEIAVKDVSLTQIWVGLISNVLPLVLMVIFFLFIIRQARGAQDSIFSFGQSRAKLFKKSASQITFKNVAGVDEAKRELEEIVD